MGKKEFKTYVKSQIAVNFDKDNEHAVGKQERIIQRNISQKTSSSERR